MLFIKSVAKYIFSNFYWIIPTVATLVMIYYVKRTSKDQVKNAAENTAIQIKSQIKEQYRPFLEYRDIKRRTKPDGDIFISVNDKLHMNSPAEVNPEYIRIEINNIGRGIATNIRIFRIMNQEEQLEYTKKGNLEPINCNVDIPYTLSLMLRPYNKESILNYLILFQDLHGNVYSSLLTISSPQETYPEHVVYRDDLVDFNAKVSKLNVNYDEVLKKYNKSYKKPPTGEDR